MKKILTKKCDICAMKSSWKFSDEQTKAKYIKELSVEFVLSGSETSGFELQITPEKYPPAIYKYETVEEALGDVEDMCGTSDIEWDA